MISKVSSTVLLVDHAPGSRHDVKNSLKSTHKIILKSKISSIFIAEFCAGES